MNLRNNYYSFYILALQIISIHDILNWTWQYLTKLNFEKECKLIGRLFSRSVLKWIAKQEETYQRERPKKNGGTRNIWTRKNEWNRKNEKKEEHIKKNEWEKTKENKWERWRKTRENSIFSNANPMWPNLVVLFLKKIVLNASTASLGVKNHWPYNLFLMKEDAKLVRITHQFHVLAAQKMFRLN